MNRLTGTALALLSAAAIGVTAAGSASAAPAPTMAPHYSTGGCHLGTTVHATSTADYLKPGYQTLHVSASQTDDYQRWYVTWWMGSTLHTSHGTSYFGSSSYVNKTLPSGIVKAGVTWSAYGGRGTCYAQTTD